MPQAARAGTLGTLGCFSFYPTKNLGAYGDGGMVTTNDDALADITQLLHVHGARPKYHHRMVGVNSRLDALQAAILSVKLQYLDQWSAARASVADRYDAALADIDGIVTPYRAPDRSHIFHQYTVRVLDGKRDALRKALTDAGIGTMIYYPVPLHLQECFRHLGYREGQLPESERASREALSLPIFPELTEEEQEAVIEAIKGFGARSA
jgi:dTDP-4-amino-4,6-dideoxygalactose transaminase